MINRYFNPFTDFGFKKLFGEEANCCFCHRMSTGGTGQEIDSL